MTSAYRRDHIKGVRNDEFERLTEPGRMSIIASSELFAASAADEDTPIPSAGEKLALRRAMARFLIDSGIASARGWV